MYPYCVHVGVSDVFRFFYPFLPGAGTLRLMLAAVRRALYRPVLIPLDRSFWNCCLWWLASAFFLLFSRKCNAVAGILRAWLRWEGARFLSVQYGAINEGFI